MDALILLVGFWVLGVFILRREWLIEEERFKYIRDLSFIAFGAGVALHILDGKRFYGSGTLLAPLLTLLLFRLYRKVFLMLYKREPKDTWHNWEGVLAADRLFNILYSVSAMLVLVFTAIGVDELAQAGR